MSSNWYFLGWITNSENTDPTEIVLSCEPGLFSLSGSNSNLICNYILSPERGTYSIAIGTTELLVSRILYCETSTYTLVGSPLGMAEYVLTSDSGSYIISGEPLDLIVNRVMYAGSGIYTVSGSSATLTHRILGDTAYTGETILESPIVHSSIIYKNDITEIRLNTGIYLDDATSFIIKVRKPSGIEVDWVAEQYLSTTYITYTTRASDLNESGEYALQSYITWGGSPSPLGDTATIIVEDPFTIRSNVSDIINKFKIYYRNITVQTYDEHNSVPEENDNAEILYDSFDEYMYQALDELDNIVSYKNIVLTDTQEKVALCHLVADYYEMGETDWSHRSQSMGSGVSFSRGEDTGARLALNKLLDQVQAAANATRRPSVRMNASSIKHVKDSTNYPRRFKKTALPSWNFSEDGFDSEEVPDVGGNYTDRTY